MSRPGKVARLAVAAAVAAAVAGAVAIGAPSVAFAQGPEVGGAGDRFYLKNTHTGGNADITYSCGSIGDGIVVGDWDGNGTDTLGVRRGNVYHLKNTHTGGNADVMFSYGTAADAVLVTDTLGLRRLLVRPVTPSGVGEAQRILAKFRIPVGPVDGIWGARTAQGICTFRQMAGLPVSRAAITTADLVKLRQYDAAYSSLSSIPAAARNGRSTYLLAQKTCQTMLYASGGRYVRVFRISTGQAKWETPAGNFSLGPTYPGWSCSTLYPEACYERHVGMNALTDVHDVLYSTYGNMYNKRSFYGSFMLHGSPFVPTYPASHGCIRVSVSESDWLYRNVTHAGGVIHFSVIGHY
jgi:hypothetical protein